MLGKCQECKESEAEVVFNPTSLFPPFPNIKVVFFTFPNIITLKVLFKPCQHMTACPSCAASLTGCPQCGAEVEEKVVKPGVELAIALELELEHILHSVEIVKPGVPLLQTSSLSLSFTFS